MLTKYSFKTFKSIMSTLIDLFTLSLLILHVYFMQIKILRRNVKIGQSLILNITIFIIDENAASHKLYVNWIPVIF